MPKKMIDQLERLVTIMLAEQHGRGKYGPYAKVVRTSLLEEMEAELRRRGWNMDAVFLSMKEQRKAEYHAYLARRAEREATKDGSHGTEQHRPDQQ